MSTASTYGSEMAKLALDDVPGTTPGSEEDELAALYRELDGLQLDAPDGERAACSTTPADGQDQEQCPPYQIISQHGEKAAKPHNRAVRREFQKQAQTSQTKWTQFQSRGQEEVSDEASSESRDVVGAASPETKSEGSDQGSRVKFEIKLKTGKKSPKKSPVLTQKDAQGSSPTTGRPDGVEPATHADDIPKVCWVCSHDCSKDRRLRDERGYFHQDCKKAAQKRMSRQTTTTSTVVAAGRVNEPYRTDNHATASGDVMENIGTGESGWVWDEVSGYYYEPRWGYYYDCKSGMYYKDGMWCTQPQPLSYNEPTQSISSSPPTQAFEQESSCTWFAILDTNCLMNEEELSALRYFEKANDSVVLVLPHVVVRELDGLKREEERTGFEARAALRFISVALQDGAPWLRAQRYDETEPLSGSNVLTACIIPNITTMGRSDPSS